MRVLLVEDNIADIIIVQEAFEELGNGFHLDFVKEGGMVFDKIERSSNGNAPRSYELILLDINIPAPNGRDILRQIRGNRGFDDVHVVILTTSNDIRDIEFAYQHQVNAFVTKPPEIDDFLDTIKKIILFFENEIISGNECIVQ